MRTYLLLLLSFLSVSAFAQDHLTGKPSIFLDCQTNCYTTYIKQEITFVDYKRDRQVSDIYVLVTQQGASAGAREIQMIFDYQQFPQLKTDTIKYIRPANISELVERELFEKNFRTGLLPAIALSSIANNISYEVDVPEETTTETITAEEKDPWNYWSFEASANINFNGESTFQQQNYFGRISASRVTEKNKFYIQTRYSLNKSRFTLSDGEEVSSENRRTNTFAQHVISLNDHWSAGARTSFGQSSFGNTDFEFVIKPAIEYNIYPYAENQTRRFSFMYSVGPQFRDYTEITIFDKMKETRWTQGLDIEFGLTKKWGDIEFDIEFDQYLHDLSLFSISFNPDIELNLVKGLSLNFGGYIEYVGDRINIAKGEISDQDIILQNIQLDTNYSFFTYMGFRYRFGSQNNNVINPRF